LEATKSRARQKRRSRALRLSLDHPATL